MPVDLGAAFRPLLPTPPDKPTDAMTKAEIIARINEAIGFANREQRDPFNTSQYALFLLDVIRLLAEYLPDDLNARVDR